MNNNTCWCTGHGLVMKIGDFGMSRQIIMASNAAGEVGLERALSSNIIGTAAYCAPELLLAESPVKRNKASAATVLKSDVSIIQAAAAAAVAACDAAAVAAAAVVTCDAAAVVAAAAAVATCDDAAAVAAAAVATCAAAAVATRDPAAGVCDVNAANLKYVGQRLSLKPCTASK